MALVKFKPVLWHYYIKMLYSSKQADLVSLGGKSFESIFRWGKDIRFSLYIWKIKKLVCKMCKVYINLEFRVLKYLLWNRRRKVFFFILITVKTRLSWNRKQVLTESVIFFLLLYNDLDNFLKISYKNQLCIFLKQNFKISKLSMIWG